MMNSFASIAGRYLRCRIGALTNNGRHGAVYPAYMSTKAEGYSSKASELKSVLPKLWITKMRTAFAWLDVDGDGYMTENDFTVWVTEMHKKFPDMSEEQKNILVSNRKGIWNDLYGAKGKGPDYKVTEDMYIEQLFHITTLEGSEDLVKKEWAKTFEVIDINKDGVVSKSEHRLLFAAWNFKDLIAASVAFTAIDENMDGMISFDEFTKAGTEFFFNFTDETKPSKYMFGPLKY